MRNINRRGAARSHTSRELPNINSHSSRELPHLAQPSPRFHKGFASSYLGQVSEEIGHKNVEYEEMVGKNLTQQQHRLKGILRKMNDDTMKLISEYTPRGKKQQNHRTVASILAIRETEAHNNNRILAICQAEIQILKDRSLLLHNHSKQDFNQQINKTVKQVVALQEEIKELRVDNQRNGKAIVAEQKAIDQGLFKKLETDTMLAEHRAKKLRSDDKRVCEQIAMCQQKTKSISSRWKEAQKMLGEIEKLSKNRAQENSTAYELEQKKVKMEKLQKKKESDHQKWQFHYYRALKLLEESNKSVSLADEKVQKTFICIEASKMAIIKLEAELARAKKKKRERDRSINEFLKSRMDDTSLSIRKMRQGFQGEMPSEIDNQEALDRTMTEKDLRQNDILKQQPAIPSEGAKAEQRMKEQFNPEAAKQIIHQ